MIRLLFIVLLILFSVYTSSLGQVEQESYLKGLANLETKKFPEAIDQFTEVINNGNNDYFVYLKRGEAFMGNGNYDLAIKDFQSANLLEEGSGSLGLARIYALSGKPELAIKNLEEHLKSSFKESERRIKLDIAFQSLEKSREWVSLWRKDWYSPDEYLIQEIEYYIQHENYKEAKALLSNALAENPDYGKLWSLSARVNIGTNNYKASLEDYDKALKYDKDNREYLVGRAELLIKMKKYNDALKGFNRAIYLYPDQLGLYYKRSILNRDLGNYLKAVEDVKFYLDYYYEDEKAWYLCGILYTDQNLYLSALECFNKLIEINPRNSRNFIARADAYLKTRTYKYAINDYSMALDLDPWNSDTYLNRGIANVFIGNLKAACYDFDRSRKLGNKEAEIKYHKYCQ
jgi:tetratricopeptide (TPR) repeat protein